MTCSCKGFCLGCFIGEVENHILDAKTPQSLMNYDRVDAVLVLLESVRDGIPL